MYPTSTLAKEKKFSLTGFALLAFVAAALAGWAVPAHAYRMIQTTETGRVTGGLRVACNDPGGFLHWSINHTYWFHNTAGQGWNKAPALQAAMQSWTDVHGAGHVLNYSGTTTAGWATDNRNTILWSTGNGCTGPSIALTALVIQGNQVIVESDITFNASYSWTTNGTKYDTQAVATHELGHALGIHHTLAPYTPRPTMYSAYFGSGARSLESDDHLALACSETHYPVTPPPPPPPTSCNPLQCFVQCSGYGQCINGQCVCSIPP